MTNAELIAALNRLDALFRDESKWTQFEAYRNKRGEPCRRIADAVSFCLLGGVFTAALESYDSVCSELHRTALLGPSEDNKLLSKWNDAPERTFADVKRLIADTRARLEAV